MLKLSTLSHVMLSDGVVRLLRDKNIVTVSDLLQTDSNKLKQILNIELVDLGTLKRDLWILIGFSPITGLQHHELLVNQSSYISTGIKSLDELIGGGFLSGNVIDICGLSASGKTQMYSTIAVNWAANYDYQTFVIDTKGDFSGDRINQMLLNREELSVDMRKRIMRNIKVEHCNSPFKLIELIRDLLDKVTSYPRFKLFVIDSLPSLWYLFHGNKRSLNHRNLVILGDLLRKLAVEHSIVVVTINIVTRTTTVKDIGDMHAINDSIRTDQTDVNLMDQTESSMSTTESSMSTTMPGLGKYWKLICSFRLQIERQIDTSNSKLNLTATKLLNERTIRILKSNNQKEDICCTVNLTNTGIN